MAEPLIGRLPAFYSDSREMTELFRSEDEEIASAEQALERLLDDRFVLTASVEAIRRHERLLGIRADEAQESLAFRRVRVVNRYSTKPPFTLRYLQERLDDLVGKGRALAQVDLEAQVLTISAAIQNAPLFREVEQTVTALKPASLVYVQQTAVADTLRLREGIRHRRLARETRLGSWKLGATGFTTEKEEVIVR